jgi:DNA-binding winged helix-turn-helix (wHTH) protein
MRLVFRPHVLDTERRELVVAGQLVAVSTRAFDLLCLLVKARPAVVSKDTLMTALWPDAHVSDNSLAVLIAELRAALGETAHAGGAIRTVHRVGYAFVAETTEAPAHAARFVLVGGDRPWPLPDGECVVGRDPAATCVVVAPGVSRRHARLVVSPAGIEVHDLASKNGTFVQGCRVIAPTRVDDGAELRFGSVPFTVRAVGPAADTATEP